MDWVPGHLYGTSVTVAPQAQANVPLIDPLLWASSTEIVGRIEDQSAFQLLRIVGYFQFAWVVNTDDALVMHRLWPNFQDQALAVPIPPGLLWEPVAGGDEVANEKFWWERRHSGLDIALNPPDWYSAFFHPYHMVADHRVNEWISSSMVPTWSVYNDSQASSLRATHYFRLLTGRTA